MSQKFIITNLKSVKVDRFKKSVNIILIDTYNNKTEITGISNLNILGGI